jgi:hypothetical protein
MHGMSAVAGVRAVGSCMTTMTALRTAMPGARKLGGFPGRLRVGADRPRIGRPAPRRIGCLVGRVTGTMPLVRVVLVVL